MPKIKLREVLDTHRLNFRFTQWPITVLDPFEIADGIVQKLHQQRAEIDADPRLTPEGKRDARVKAREAALKAIADWHAPRLAGLDADLGAHRAALVPPATEKPDARRIDFLLSHLRDRSPMEIATFYNSATDEERLVMEAAAASVGRVPLKSAKGLEWQPLLDPESVNESIVARATARNPQGARKLAELAEIRALQVGVAGVAASEIREALS
jgi:hypothetical protein